MLRADNQGEGGVLSLSSLVGSSTRNSRLWGPVAAIGILGAALFFGDGILTPAISVLSAVEGVTIAAPHWSTSWCRSRSEYLLRCLPCNGRGPSASGACSARLSCVWFVTLGVLGLIQIVKVPHVLMALSPAAAVEFFANNGVQGFVVLSAVFLVVTGGEALYADLGHFGRIPIRMDGCDSSFQH